MQRSTIGKYALTAKELCEILSFSFSLSASTLMTMGGGWGDFRRLNPCGVVGVLVTLTQDTHDGNFLAKTQYRLIFKDRRQRS